MTVFFLFLDGVGLSADDPAVNPRARAEMPNLQTLLAGRRMTKDAAPFENIRATLLALDANLGVPGLPQSATGQAVLLTGENVPAALGHHYGPKPNPAVNHAGIPLHTAEDLYAGRALSADFTGAGWRRQMASRMRSASFFSDMASCP